MEVINPEHIVTTLDQIGGNARVKRDLVRMHLMTLILSAQCEASRQYEHDGLAPNRMGGTQRLSKA